MTFQKKRVSCKKGVSYLEIMENFPKKFSCEQLLFRFVSYTFRKRVLNYRTHSFLLRILMNENLKKKNKQ